MVTLPGRLSLHCPEAIIVLCVLIRASRCSFQNATLRIRTILQNRGFTVTVFERKKRGRAKGSHSPYSLFQMGYARRICASEAIAVPPLMSGMMLNSSIVTAGSST